ncbi:MAG TPA: triple tyrosine motif-containing protein, partial [Bacteroidota bacterium]|nr:triple tyrosine motif-containing protein [Bacteroidota bacterium]
GMITAGNPLSSMDYLVQNYSGTSWNGTVHVKVYIFEHGKSVTSGTLVQSHSFEGQFTARSSQRVTVESPVMIPSDIPKGSYKIGVFLDISDSNTSNNSNAFSGAADIWVDAETTAPTIQITHPTSKPTYPTDQATVNISGTASDNVGVTEITWVNSSTGAAGTASGTATWAANGIPLNKGSNVVSVTAQDAAGNKGTATLTVAYTPVDVNPPDTMITSGPSGTITSNSASFTFTGSDNVTPTGNLVYATWLQGYENGWSDFSAATVKSYSNLPDGSYTFQVKAKDEAQNIDQTPATRSFTVAVTGCSYSISPSGNTFGPGGGSGGLHVTASAGCSWTASTNDGNGDWIRINSGSRESGNGAVNYSVSANNTGSTRTGTLTVAGQAYTVIQSGGDASCAYTLSVNVSPPGSGTVTKNPQKDAYCPGDQVTLHANSDSGYPFSSWRGVDSSSGATARVTMNGNRTSTAFFTANEEVKLPSTWTDEGIRYPLNYLGGSSQSMNRPLKVGDYHPISFSFENSGDVEIEVTGPSRMCIGLYSAATGSLLSYSNGLGDLRTTIKYPVSGNMAYHLVVTPCVSSMNNWAFSINGPSSFGDEFHLGNDFKGSIQGSINSIYDRRFYLVTAPPNVAKGLIVTLLPEQKFNGLLRLFDDKGETLVPSANNPNDGAIDVLTYGRVIPGQTYYICVEGYSANQHQGTGSYELRVEFLR